MSSKWVIPTHFFLLVTHQVFPCEFLIGDVLFVGSVSVVQVNTDNCEAFVSVEFQLLLHVRDFRSTRSTPAGPEVDKNNFAAVFFPLKVFAIGGTPIDLHELARQSNSSSRPPDAIRSRADLWVLRTCSECCQTIIEDAGDFALKSSANSGSCTVEVAIESFFFSNFEEVVDERIACLGLHGANSRSTSDQLLDDDQFLNEWSFVLFKTFQKFSQLFAS